ncbi:uncharacterized protein PADG_06209 [Paracoccidioides brasiliensis Pb18]|uniref:Uncharacterized protein n=1 Tax=Paracoccidioides brasiliensis (strain Pb18) TaxID=502780 RepID=C1GGZ0_PARBD|nr:uncharacterized protein PADG_06209 [Paracoccidioides brasiliensis Pb18]EEH50130.2 hypothetical protein PADG_06209 [Paracoccidioides brasiliensis Pb18]
MSDSGATVAWIEQSLVKAGDFVQHIPGLNQGAQGGAGPHSGFGAAGYKACHSTQPAMARTNNVEDVWVNTPGEYSFQSCVQRISGAITPNLHQGNHRCHRKTAREATKEDPTTGSSNELPPSCDRHLEAPVLHCNGCLRRPLVTSLAETQDNSAIHVSKM